ncbi:ClbS/DfsB family four-helix bundle protein [Vibrio sp. MA40-2]|uniref:ClbS/DfsB family four-helix bundle protein n=1 Tax=Vibrio sp. MA40-2 TaxID=3391828 RepID=UPI0039A4E339
MGSHQTAVELVGSFSNEELFTKQYFDWTGTTSLGSYCISALPSHYDWALKPTPRSRKTDLVSVQHNVLTK